MESSEYNEGYKLGRSGAICPFDVTSEFKRGYDKGLIAYEEWYNGYDPRFDQ